MKNSKGFTLIEMLGTIAILGILGTIVVAGVTKYLGSSRKKAYKMLHDAAYEAVSNCASESNCILSNNSTITVDELKSKGYLDSFKNPKSNSGDCTGKVTVKVKESSGTGKINSSDSLYGNKKVEIDEANTKYLYKVEVSCTGFKEEPIYYPNGTTEEDWNE